MKINLALFFLLVANVAFAQEIAFTPQKLSVANYSYLDRQKDSAIFSKSSYFTNLIHIGLEAGLNTSNTIYSQHPYFKGFITGLNAGVTLDVPVEFSFSLDAAVLYSQKGYSSTTNYGDYTQRLNFIDVPILFKVASTNSKFNFFIGPQLSILASENNTFEDGFTGNRSNYNYVGGRFFIDGVVGESFDITPNFNIYVSYAIDFGRSNSVTLPDYHNQVYQIGVGVRLN